VQKIGWKNRVRILFVIQKEKKQPGFFSFKLQIASRKKYGTDPKKISADQPDKLDIRVQIDWAIISTSR
jgi:hypothetical protein